MFIVRTLFIFLALNITSCEEEIVNQPPNTGETPQQVSDVVVQSRSGGAVITYKITDKATDYVLAEYETRPGKIHQEKASKYKNTLTLKGFAKAGVYNISVYSVNISEERSDPMNISVEVLTPPIVSSFNTLATRADFGGINVSLTNEGKADLAIEVLTLDNVTNKVVTADVHYSSQDEIMFAARGFDTKPRDFWITMRDRWGNTTDTIMANVTPFSETQLDRTLMKEVVLPTDYKDSFSWHSWSGISPRAPRFLFDGKTTSANDVLHSRPNSGIPMHFTVDLGVPTSLSRFKIWQRNRSVEHYAGGNPKTFELWGSANPNLDGTFGSWTLLGTYTIIKPSGTSVGSVNSEDLEALKAGHEFSVPLEAGEIRFIRFKTLKTWGNVKNVTFAELAFWGSF